MPPRKQPAKQPEFPILEANGLYAHKTKGDGNCLFNAISDQLYGHQNEHRALREATNLHMRAHNDFYRQYMIINPVRRNPKRKVTASLHPPVDTAFHSTEELQKEFDTHVAKMGQPGEWADNMEVSAFASALNVHVRLWQADFHYTFSPRQPPENHTDTVDNRPVLNIAYHNWEHYSSVRNIGGPHDGLPNISSTINLTPSKKRSSMERDDEEQIFRANKRRSPMPLFDSDSTPEGTGTESSSDESIEPAQCSQEAAQEEELPELPPQKIKLILKLRAPATTV